MFGIIRPCRHRLGEELKAAWLAHLCGTCLSLRDDHGQAARLATNYDGLVISVLAEAQADGAPARRAAGRCALRGMRKADVAAGDCARLAATVSLVLAAAKLHDHADDGDGLAGRRAVRSVATGLAARWAAAAQRTGREIGFEVGLLTEAVGRQAAVEAAAGPGTPLLTVTEPTETATGAAFAHTAVLARKPGNAEALAEAGRLFGRIAHLLDAVEDLRADATNGTWNPLVATGTDLTEARRLCDDALLGLRLALNEVDFTEARLVHALLVHEVAHSVQRIFAAATGTPASSHHPHADPSKGASRGAVLAAALACGLPVAGLAGVFDVRRHCWCERVCCCDPCREACCEAGCEGCGEACGEGCCGGCAEACCGSCG